MKKPEFNFYSQTELKAYNLDESMKYQLNILGSLDSVTRQHSENVANLACRLCEYLHLSKSFTVYCTICAYLHDIGKQGIPPKILQKNGPLTDEEYEIIKTHTTIGYNICFDDLKLRPYIAGPLYHHESLNGTGYPNGVTEKEIPLEGQIIRIADEYDAITSKRQYKTHVGITDTLKILIENSEPTPDNPKAKLKKVGKINKKLLRRFFRVVIDDTEYEISQIFDYVEFLKEQVKRLETIDVYYRKMNEAKKEDKKNYYLEGIKLLLRDGETVENYAEVLVEYKDAYVKRKQIIYNLFEEVRKIKKLKV